MSSLTEWPQRLVDALLPPRCGFCGGIGEPVCGDCRAELPVNEPACRRCARPMVVAGVCGACQARPPPFECVVAPMRYAYPVDAAIRAFKYRHQETRLASLSRLLQPGVDALPDGIEAVVAMPMHYRRRIVRGFNQAALLAAPVARRLGVPLFDGVGKRRHTPPQSTLSGQARRSNLAGAFRCSKRVPYQHVLVVDDVYTSGESAKHLARALRAACADRVSVLAIARAD